ncbi:hypothetical protein BH09ACT7_BH09ACT7_44180 [soil metagenome]
MAAPEPNVDKPESDDEKAKRAARQAEYMKRAAGNCRVERKGRRASLKKRETYDAITRATQRLQGLAHPDQPYVVIRSEFLLLGTPRPYPPPARQPENIATRPSLTRVHHGKNPHAVPLYLNGFFEYQMRAAYRNSPGAPPEPSRRRNAVNNPLDKATNWITLTALDIDGVHIRNQRKSFTRALDALRKWDLVSLGDTGQRYAKFKFRREDGSGREYTIPQGTPIAPKHFCIPTEFFTAGWHLVLTPNELVTFLALCHVADLRLRHDGSTIMFLAEQFRYSLLGLTDEAYVSIHELAEFGLIEVTDPMPNRKRGRIQLGGTGGKPPEPYNISVPMFGGKPSTDALFDRSKFDTPAIDRVIFNLGFQAPRFM